ERVPCHDRTGPTVPDSAEGNSTRRAWADALFGHVSGRDDTGVRAAKVHGLRDGSPAIASRPRVSVHLSEMDRSRAGIHGLDEQAQSLAELVVGTRSDRDGVEGLAELDLDAPSILVDHDSLHGAALALLQELERPVLVASALGETRDALGFVGE